MPKQLNRALLACLIASLGATGILFLADPARAAQPPVGLGTATSFAVLAGSTVTNTGPSVISGSLGVDPGTSVVGFPPGVVDNGSIHATDAAAAQAQADTTTAYNDAAGRGPAAAITSDLGGQTLVAGVYSGPTLALTGTPTLNAEGDPNAVFVLQTSSTLITASSSVVALSNGASACNVFWQVGSSATLGTGSTMVGTVLALTSITAQTNAGVTGRLMARNDAVTLDTNVISVPSCATTQPVSPSPSPSPSASPSGSPSPSASPSASASAIASASASLSASASSSPSNAGTPSPVDGAGNAHAVSSSASPSTAAISDGDVGGLLSSTTVSDTSLPYTGSSIAAAAAAGLVALVSGCLLLVSAECRKQKHTAA